MNEGEIQLMRPQRKRKKQENSSMWPGQYMRGKKTPKKPSHLERSGTRERLQGSLGWSRAVYVWFADIALRLASSVAPAAEASQS